MDGEINEYAVPYAAKPRKNYLTTLYIAFGVLIVLIFIGFIGLAIFWVSQNFAPEVEAIRDMFIILLALESCLFGIAFVLLLAMVARLIIMLEFEIKPILQQTNETINTVRGTTKFVSQTVVKPVTEVKSYFAAIKRGASVLFGDGKRNLPD